MFLPLSFAAQILGLRQNTSLQKRLRQSLRLQNICHSAFVVGTVQCFEISPTRGTCAYNGYRLDLLIVRHRRVSNKVV